jgi:hypothetical protein
MFRRIELISEYGLNRITKEFGKDTYFKHGLVGASPLEVIEAWINIPKAPKHLHKNCRFFFTELGWKLFGSKTVEACKKVGQRFRIITIKEKSVDPFYKDKWQVAVRPRKK